MSGQVEALDEITVGIVHEALDAKKYRTQPEIAQILAWKIPTQSIATAVKVLESQGRAERCPPNSAGVQLPAWRKRGGN